MRQNRACYVDSLQTTREYFYQSTVFLLLSEFPTSTYYTGVQRFQKKVLNKFWKPFCKILTTSSTTIKSNSFYWRKLRRLFLLSLQLINGISNRSLHKNVYSQFQPIFRYQRKYTQKQYCTNSIDYHKPTNGSVHRHCKIKNLNKTIKAIILEILISFKTAPSIWTYLLCK